MRARDCSIVQSLKRVYALRDFRSHMELLLEVNANLHMGMRSGKRAATCGNGPATL